MSATQTLVSGWGRAPLTVGALVPTAALRHHLGRVHVATSPREVLRDVRDAIGKSPDRDRFGRETRRETYRAALWIHAENGAEYAAVMGGRF